jgi:ABC-type phosphate/phosphonate transport system substrate-binding protein
MDVDGIVAALLAGPLPEGPLIAALPMYDWPEERAVVDAQWVRLRDALLAKGVDAPERLARCNADLPTFNGSSVDLAPDEFDLQALWRHPGLLISQTCWGPMELGLETHVRVVGQEDYAGVEGGDGELYCSVIVVRGDSKLLSEAPPSVLSDISPTSGEIGAPPTAANHQQLVQNTNGVDWQKPRRERSPHLRGRCHEVTEGGASLTALLNGQRLAYNAPDSMSGYLALQRDLAAAGLGMEIFSERIFSGGHRQSIRMVASGAADVATVDCKTWGLALKHEPAARELVVVGWTQKRLGLPFITAKAC